MRKHNSPVNKRLGMNQQNSSEQHSQGNVGKRKNEKESTSDTNPVTGMFSYGSPHQRDTTKHPRYGSIPYGELPPPYKL